MLFFILLFIAAWMFQGYILQDLIVRWPELIIGLVGFAILGKLKTVIQNQKKFLRLWIFRWRNRKHPRRTRRTRRSPRPSCSRKKSRSQRCRRSPPTRPLSSRMSRRTTNGSSPDQNRGTTVGLPFSLYLRLTAIPKLPSQSKIIHMGVRTTLFFILLFIAAWMFQGYILQDLIVRWPELITGLVGFAILGKLKTVIQNQKKFFKALDIPVEEPETPEADKKNAEEPRPSCSRINVAGRKLRLPPDLQKSPEPTAGRNLHNKEPWDRRSSVPRPLFEWGAIRYMEREG